MKKLSGFIAAGAFSRESIVVIRPLSASRITMKPPPPIPQLYGSTTPSTPAAGTAASKALPPALSTLIAARVASGASPAAAPPVPFAVGCFICAPAAGADSATTAMAAPTGSQRNPLTCASSSRFCPALPPGLRGHASEVDAQDLGGRILAAEREDAGDVGGRPGG